MNKQELIGKIKSAETLYLSLTPFIGKKLILDLVKQLDEPQPIKLKDVIARIKQLDIGTRKAWLDEFLNELGSDYGTLKYKDGYEQGKLEGGWVGQQLKDADKIRQELNKPVVKQFVADWYEKHKNNIDFEIWHYLHSFSSQKEDEFKKWMNKLGEEQIQTLVNMHQFGYEVEKEKRYLVTMKGKIEENVLTYGNNIFRYFFTRESTSEAVRIYHTRKELEESGFGWVFDCPGIEIEEVECE